MSISNTQYNEIQRKYDARQLHNQHVVQQRKTALYEKYPRLKELDNLIASASVKSAKRLLEKGDHTALLQLKQQLDYYRTEREAILTSAGLDEYYLEPPYACPDCKDTGYINGQPCHCFKQAVIDLVYTQSNIKHILQEENFSTFTYRYYSDSPSKRDNANGLTPLENAKNAVSIVCNFISNFDIRFENIFFYGDAGTGKTFLSNCIAKELLDTGHSVIYLSSFQLFDVLEKNKFQKDTDAATSIQNIFECELLIIDDLGSEMTNSFTTSQLFHCLNERILRKKSTIISTNWGIDALSAIYSERVFSRVISAYRVIKLFGDDIRLQKRKL